MEQRAEMNDVVSEPIAPDVLARRIEGVRLAGATLQDELARETRLLVFLRHFG